MTICLRLFADGVVETNLVKIVISQPKPGFSNQTKDFGHRRVKKGLSKTGIVAQPIGGQILWTNGQYDDEPSEFTMDMRIVLCPKNNISKHFKRVEPSFLNLYYIYIYMYTCMIYYVLDVDKI